MSVREERLKHLIEILEDVENNKLSRFNMTDWSTITDENEDMTDVEFYKECNFAGCAFGWATLDPHFRSLGLDFDMMDGSPLFFRSINDDEPLGDYAAASAFFDISETESFFLFDPYSYLPPFSINSHMNRIIKERNLHEDENYVFPYGKGKRYGTIDITPRMVINRINHILTNPMND